eukprot:CAMPEP_0194048002 /NCGR_PEP_ID=MMETSP0009_2-20130614/26509_1 /TAXON_ID=210454 /ORGANISM="Grammatophora oceanica, Strain CCMP 410" /LENGTH=160 /DNA_ID=CAMNT_0038693779 /DNA_START=11 /DNA_END=493 /DNA_ORIENTATION=+
MTKLAVAVRRCVVAGARQRGAVTATRSFSWIKKKDEYVYSTMDPKKHGLLQEESPYELGKHRSNALELVQKQPIIFVEGERVVCDGGGGALGHPLEYISLERPGYIQTCTYCGLKYARKGDELLVEENEYDSKVDGQHSQKTLAPEKLFKELTEDPLKFD